MPIRTIVRIDEDLCDGCGDCITACAEGAIAIIDGKAKLVSDVYCDGLGACLGHCPQGAISMIERDADDFDEQAVADHLGPTTPERPPASVAPLPIAGGGQPHSCPGARAQSLGDGRPTPVMGAAADQQSQLAHWPIQLHLVPPTAPFFHHAEVLLAADCVAFAVGGFHSRHLAGKSLAIACPKLDSNQEVYVEKLATMIDVAEISSLTVMVMEVPCCSGLVHLVRAALERANRRPPVEIKVVGVRGTIVAEQALL